MYALAVLVLDINKSINGLSEGRGGLGGVLRREGAL